VNEKFSINPIVVKHKGKNIGIIELDFDSTEKNFILEITDEHGEALFRGYVDSDTFLSVDSTAISINLKYLDGVEKDVLLSKRINLLNLFSIDDVEMDTLQKSATEQTMYEVISAKVKDQMDSPKGSPKEVEYHTQMLTKSTMSQDARDYVTKKIRHIVSQYSELSESQLESFTHRIYSNFYGMGILQDIDDNPDVGEIMVNAYTYPEFRCDVYYVKKQVKYLSEQTFASLDDLMNVFSRSIAFSKKELNNVENALVEATRANRDRVNIIIPDASESYVMNIRKFGNFVPNLNGMRASGTVDAFIEFLMKILVLGHANIGIGGAMGTGKTTFINFLLSYTPKEERKVIIASVSETDVERVLKGHDIVILNVDDEKNFSFSKLARASLRTTASRVIIPESRGDEFKQVYEMNLKTKGNMFTGHALDDHSFMDVCVDMYNGEGGQSQVEAVRNKLAKAIDIVIIKKKVGNDIRLKSISELILDENRNYKGMNMLYYFEQDPEDVTKGHYVRTSNRMSNRLKLQLNEAGVPMSMMVDV
jgi:pilus assembly protein CpaF